MENNINVQVYSSCNCDCEFCHYKDKLFHKIDPKFVLDYLKQNNEINYIVLTGGEPTLAIESYREILKEIDTTTKRVVLQTNGWWGNNDLAKDVIKSNPPSIVHLSVDSQKQKSISIDTTIAAYQFLLENKIKTYLVNHTDSDEEFQYYREIFPSLKRGEIVSEDSDFLHDCGTALLADNSVGKLNVKGWL